MYSKRPLIITKMSDNTNMDCTIAVSVQCTIAKKVGFAG